MATATGRARCITCDKEKRTVKCEGCSQLFCFDHLPDHRQQFSAQLDEIEVNRDIFRQTLTEQTVDLKNHSLIKQIDRWEDDSIKQIQQTATQCRQLILQHSSDHIHQIEINLVNLTDELRLTRQENDFNEIDLRELKQKLTQLTEELHKTSDISIQRGSGALVNKISVIAPSRHLSLPSHINIDTKWKQNGITIAGGNGQGDQLNQFSHPYGIYVDDDTQCIYIADWENHRIVEWKSGAKSGHVVAGGNGQGNRLDQLNSPRDVIVDKKNDSIIICDQENSRLIRWPRRNGTNGETIISDINCSRLAMDNNGNLYVSDWKNNEVTRWKIGDTNGTIVAGGNGKGDNLNQLNTPTYIFVDEDYSVYVTDRENQRVMKWLRGAKEGIVVAGGKGKGDGLIQLSDPQGVVVDNLGNVYVADTYNHRVMRWLKGSREGSIIVGGNGKGEKPNQFNHFGGLSFDRQGNLYVVDYNNHRIQKFDIISS